MSAKYALNLTFFRIWRGSFHFDSIKCIQVYSGWYRSNVNCSPTDSLFTFTYFLSRKSWENKIWLDCSSCVSPRARRGHCLTVAKLQSCCLVSFSHFTVWHQLIIIWKKKNALKLKWKLLRLIIYLFWLSFRKDVKCDVQVLVQFHSRLLFLLLSLNVIKVKG